MSFGRVNSDLFFVICLCRNRLKSKIKDQFVYLASPEWPHAEASSYATGGGKTTLLLIAPCGLKEGKLQESKLVKIRIIANKVMKRESKVESFVQFMTSFHEVKYKIYLDIAHSRCYNKSYLRS